MSMDRRSFLTSSAVGCLALHHSVHAATYPQRPIVLVLPFGPGGATDNVMRTMAEKASR